MERITFPSEETWQPNRKVVVYPVQINDKIINCEITVLALKHAFGADLSDPLKAFQARRRLIESRTKIAIANQWFEGNGSIRLKTSDCL